MNFEDDETRPLLGQSDRVSLTASLRNRFALPSCRRKLAGMAILTVTSLERFAFYSIAANLYLYLNRQPMNWMPYNAMDASYVFTGVAFLTAIFGGWLADAVLGKFWTILLGLLLYTGGYSMLVVISSYGSNVPDICFLGHNRSAVPFSNITGNVNDSSVELSLLSFHEWAVKTHQHPLGSFAVEDDDDIDEWTEPRYEVCGFAMYFILVLIAFCVGMVRPNLAPFGADQYVDAEQASRDYYFSWFYWCINLGGFVSLGLIAYVEQAMSDGFVIGYLAATVALGTGVLVFLMGRPCYSVEKPMGSILVNVMKIVKEAYHLNIRDRMRLERQKVIPVDVPSPTEPDVVQTRSSWLDMAKVRYGGSFNEKNVEDVKSFGKVLIIFVALIPNWMVYFQMQTSFVAQGLHMKLSTNVVPIANWSSVTDNINKFTIPAAWLTLFDVVFLIVLIPVLNHFVYPFLDKRHIHLDIMIKITLGLFFSLFSVISAGVLEYYRLKLVHSSNSSMIVQVIGNTTYAAADMWVFWQIPQYMLIGISEVFASVSSLEFAYAYSPESMRAILMGVYCFFTGVGSFMGTGLLELVRPYWFTNKGHGNLNQSHLDYYFFLLSGIQFVAALIFIIVSRRCKLVRNYQQSERFSANGDGEDYYVPRTSRRTVLADSEIDCPQLSRLTLAAPAREVL